MKTNRLYLLLFLSLTSSASAATFTVGPTGSHSTIQAAIDTAIAAGGDNEIRVQSGTYFEQVSIPSPPGSLHLVGGYAADFISRDPSPTASTIDAGSGGRPLSLSCDHAEVVIESLGVTGGYVSSARSRVSGGGVLVEAQVTCSVALRNLSIFRNKDVARDHEPGAGGLGVHAAGEAVVDLKDLLIEENQIETGAGGLEFLAEDRSRIDMERSTVAKNAQLGGGTASAGDIQVHHAATISIQDSIFRENRRDIGIYGTGIHVQLWSDCFDCRLELHRDEFLRNSCSPRIPAPRGGSQVSLAGQGIGTVHMSDSLVADGEGCGGILAAPNSGSRMSITNVTIAHNQGEALISGSELSPGVDLANNIIFGNGIDDAVDLGGRPRPPVFVIAASNSFGVDPLFVDPARGDYHLLPGSPGIDRGDDFPIGGLGPRDVEGAPRIQGAHVDIGAYETPSRDSGSYFCHVTGLGPVPAVPRFTPVCRCLGDEGLRASRCAFLLPELFLDVDIPSSLKPGDPAVLDWTINPWHGEDGPYEMIFEMLQKGQWVSFASRTGKLKQGKLELVKLAVTAPSISSPLRARIRHQVAGLDKPIEEAMVVLLVVGK